MFEAAKVGRKVDKDVYLELEEELRTQLLLVQRELRQTDIPLVVIVRAWRARARARWSTLP
jgi:hypothetical protein